MRALALTICVSALAVACGGSAGPSSTTGGSGSTTGASTGGGGSTGGGSNVAPFLGSFSCTYAGTYTYTGSTTVNDNPAYSDTGVVSAGSSTDLVVSGLVAGGINGSCVTTLDITSSSTATYSPAEQSCQFTDAAGDSQTNTNTGTVTLGAGGTATFSVSGTFIGTTPAGVGYSGVFSGTWSCAKD